MIMDGIYKPWLAAAQDDARPLLNYLSVERIDDEHGVMLATDGHGMVGVPVLLTKGEAVGLVHMGALLELERQRKKLRKSHPHAERLEFELVGDEVHSLLNEPLARFTAEAGDGSELNFPDFWAIIPHAPKQFEHLESDNHNQFALNPLLMYTLARAVGLQMSNYSCDPITFFARGRRAPYIWASDWTDTRPVAPWICMMPIGGNYLDDAAYEQYTTKQRYKVAQREKHLRGPQATYLHPTI